MTNFVTFEQTLGSRETEVHYADQQIALIEAYPQDYLVTWGDHSRHFATEAATQAFVVKNLDLIALGLAVID